eukprot:symbB.v1.2.014925.t1/scaffold1103.1/size137753/1
MGNPYLPEFEGMPTSPAATPTAGSPSFSPWPACFPGAGMPWPWPPWTWQAAPQVPVQGEVEQQSSQRRHLRFKLCSSQFLDGDPGPIFEAGRTECFRMFERRLTPSPSLFS